MSDEVAESLETAATPEPQPIKQRIIMELPCRLLTHEELERSRQLAKMLTDLDALDDNHAARKLSMREERGTLEAAIRTVRRILVSGEEQREVECEDQMDYEAGLVRRVRLDDTKILSSRTMTLEERQVSFA